MIAIDTRFAVAGWPTPLRSRLRRRNTDVQSVLWIEPQHFFFPLPQEQDIPSTRTRHEASARILIKSIRFQIQALPETHVLREDVSMARLVDTQLGITVFLSRHSDEESVKFRHKQASPCQRSRQQFCEHAVMISVHLRHHVERAFSPGGIYPLMLPIVENAVGFTADGKCRDFASRVAIKHDYTCRITTTYKQPAVRLVKGHGVIDLCCSQLPLTDDFCLAAIDHKNAVGFRDIHKEVGTARLYRERFRMARKLDLGQLFHRV